MAQGSASIVSIKQAMLFDRSMQDQVLFDRLSIKQVREMIDIHQTDC
jgi:hypothetical protein